MARIINGDKPAMGMKNGNPYIFPTPWNGKEGISSMRGAQLGMIVFLEQADRDEITEIPHGEKILRIFLQMFSGEKSKESYLRLAPFIEMLDSVPAVKLLNRGTVDSACLLKQYANSVFGLEAENEG
jgi:hypothetical protein